MGLPPSRVRYLESRGVSKATQKRFGLRASGNRIGFPIHDTSGTEVNVRRHLPNPPEGIPKTVHTKGMGSPARLYPLAVLDGVPADDWVLIAGGEIDALSAIDGGLVALCSTSGEGSVPRDDLHHLEGLRVAVALDADGPGRKAAKKWFAALADVARETRIVSLPEGTDVNDWFTSGRTAADLLALVESSPDHPGDEPRRATTELLQLALAKVDSDEGRNDTGLWLACQLRDERYDKETEAWPILQAYQQTVRDDGSPAYVEAEARESLESAWSREPRDPSGKGGSAAARPVSLEDAPLAEYVASRLDGEFAYVSQLKDWLQNTGKVWKPSSPTAVSHRVRHELKLLFDAELEAGTNLSNATWLLRRAKIENVAALLRGFLEVSYSTFDNHPEHLNTPSGVVDLRTGRVVPHSDAFRFTKITRASFDPSAQHPGWEKALRALPDETRDYFQILLGQAITGYAPDHDKVTFSHGGGENGKSLLFDAVTLALGTFAGPVPEKVMIAKPGESPTEMMELRGKRLVVLEEMPQGARLSTKRLKDVAGTAVLNARPLYGKTVTWAATHTMFVTSNHRPLVTETDTGTWRRLQMVEFPYRFVRSGKLGPGERRGDPALRHHFRTVPEPAVLRWLVEGAMRWFALGMRTPDAPAAVVRATDAWRLLSDDVMQFVSAHLVFDPDGVVLAEEMWEQFDLWAKAHNKHGWSISTYADRFEEHPLFKQHGVLKRRKRVDNLGISRPTGVEGPGPHLRTATARQRTTGNLRVWLGVRWRRTSEIPGVEPGEPPPGELFP